MSVANSTRKLAEIRDVFQLLSINDEIVVSQTVELGELWVHMNSSLRPLRETHFHAESAKDTQRSQRKSLFAWLACERCKQHGDWIDAHGARIEVARIVVDHDREREFLAGGGGHVATETRR